MKLLSKTTAYGITVFLYGALLALSCLLILSQESTGLNAIACVALGGVSIWHIIKETHIYIRNKGDKMEVKMPTRLLIIATIFIGAYITSDFIIYNFKSVNFSSILFTIILSIALSWAIEIGENYGKSLIGVYGASLILSGALGGLLVCTSFFSILGETGNDTYIFDKGIFPACIFGIFFVAIGLILVIYDLKKDAIIPLLPFIVGMIILALLMNNMYIKATQNLLTIDIEHVEAAMFNLARMRDIVVISSLISWGFIIYRIKSKIRNS